MFLGIDDWLFRNAEMLICNNYCADCTDIDCKNRIVEYGFKEGKDENIRKFNKTNKKI